MSAPAQNLRFSKEKLSGYLWSVLEQIKPELELVAKMRTRIKRKLIIHIEGAVEGLLDKIKTFERSRVRQEKPDTLKITFPRGHLT